MGKCPYCGKETNFAMLRCMHCRWPLDKKVDKR